jgi:hypothetical protein
MRKKSPKSKVGEKTIKNGRTPERLFVPVLMPYFLQPDGTRWPITSGQPVNLATTPIARFYVSIEGNTAWWKQHEDTEAYVCMAD